MKKIALSVLLFSILTSCNSGSSSDSGAAGDRVREQSQTCSVPVPAGSRSSFCNYDQFWRMNGSSGSKYSGYRIYSVVTGQLIGTNDTVGFSSFSDCEKAVAASNQIVCNYDNFTSPTGSIFWTYRPYSILNGSVLAGNNSTGYSSLADCLKATSSNSRAGVPLEAIKNSNPSAVLCSGVPSPTMKATVCNYDSSPGGRSGYKIYSALSGQPIASAETFGFSSASDCETASSSSLLLACNYDKVAHSMLESSTSYTYAYIAYSVVTGLPVKTNQTYGYSSLADCLKAVSDK